MTGWDTAVPRPFDWISWGNFYMVKIWDLLRLSGVKGMQILRNRISQCYKQGKEKKQNNRTINKYKKRSRFFNSLLCTQQAKTTPSYLPAYDQNCLSTDGQVLQKCPNTIYPSSHAFTTPCLYYAMHPCHKAAWLIVCPYRTRPRQLLIRMWKYQKKTEGATR